MEPWTAVGVKVTSAERWFLWKGRCLKRVEGEKRGGSWTKSGGWRRIEEDAHERTKTLIDDFEVFTKIDRVEQFLDKVDGRWLKFFRSEEEEWVGLRDDF